MAIIGGSIQDDDDYEGRCGPLGRSSKDDLIWPDDPKTLVRLFSEEGQGTTIGCNIGNDFLTLVRPFMDNYKHVHIRDLVAVMHSEIDTEMLLRLF